MRLKTLASLITAFQSISSVWSYGTIQYVFPATCAVVPTLSTGPGVPTGSSLFTGPPAPTGSALPAMQHLLTVLPAPGGLQPRQVAAVYVRANGSTTADCALAAPFLLSNGQLSSNGQIISTSGLVPHAPLAVSSFVSAISTTFSMTNGSSILNRTTLSWTNSAFTGGRALFCIMNSTVHGVYNGQLPAGCAQISIGLVPVSSCQTFRPSTSITQTAGNATIAGISGISGTTRTTSTASGTSSSLPTESVIGSIRGQNAIAYPIGCLESSVNSPAVSPALAPVEVGTLEECVDYCSIYPYFGVQSGFCVCGNAIVNSASPLSYDSCQVPCADDVEQTCGGVSAMAVYSINRDSGATPTLGGMSSSTGIVSATTSSTSAYPISTGTPNCFDRSPFDQTINGGYLILCNTALPGFDLVRVNGTSLAECIAACNQYQSGPASSVCVAVTFNITLSSNQCRLKNNITTVVPGGEDLSEAAIAVIGPYAPEITFASVPPTTSATTGTTSPTMTMSAITTSTTVSGTMTGMTSSASVGTSSTTSTSSAAVPTVTNPNDPLCPQYNGQVVQVGGSFYQVECDTGFVGDTLVANTTTAATLSECGRYCNLYNVVISFGCVGVTLDTTSSSNNCFLMSRITGTEYRPLNDSLRLIYPGYPTPTDPVLTGPSGASSISSRASSSASTTTSTSTTTTSSTRPTATGALCPGFNGQTVLFPTYGETFYEIQCNTTFGNAALGLAATTETSLTDCINQCSFLNVNSQTPQCVGVSFDNSPQMRPNCFPKNDIVLGVGGTITDDDSARLIYSGYTGIGT